MNRKIEIVLKSIKLLLLIFAFIMIAYIMTYYCKMREITPWGTGFLSFFGMLLPFVIDLFPTVFSYFQKEQKFSFYFIIGSIISLIMIVIVCYRTLFDQNMVLWAHTPYLLNFSYYLSQTSLIKTIAYLISLGDILLLVYHNFIKETK